MSALKLMDESADKSTHDLGNQTFRVKAPVALIRENVPRAARGKGSDERPAIRAEL